MRAGGFYLMQRGWMDDDFFQSVRREPFDHRSAWCWLIEHAAHAAHSVKFNGRTVNLERGQLVSSLLHMGGAWGWDTRKVARFMAVTNERRATATASAIAGTVITICNYDEYQGASPSAAIASDARPPIPMTSDRHGREQGRTIKAEKREAKASPKKATRWAGVVCQEWIAEADAIRFNAQLPAINAGIEADKFADHWIGKSGQAGVKLDWHATWRNWVRNAKGGGAQINGKRSAVEKLYAGAAAAAEEWERREADSGAGLAPVVPLLDR